MQIHLSVLWKDERLNLSSYLVNNKKSRVFASYLVERIWQPDLIFDNVREGRLFDLTLPNVAYRVLPDGSFLKESRYILLINHSFVDFIALFFKFDSQV